MSRSFPDLVRLFDSLPVPAADAGLGRYYAKPVPGFSACAVGKDTSGHPVLLIQADNTQAGTAAPLVLEHLSVIHLACCRVLHPSNGERERTLSVLRCMGSDRTLHEFFLRSLHPVVATLGQSPSRQQISDAIERLVDLFRHIAEAPRKTVAGLWAELFIITHAHEPSTLITSWRAIPEERFDFASGSHRIEVKSASGGTRIHQFSLGQLRPPPGAAVMIATLLIERAEGGSSVADLVAAIRARVTDPSLLLRLDNVVAQTVGRDWRSVQELRFDLQLAVNSLRFVDAAVVPAVPLPLPAEITGVHFRVDLTSHPLPFPSLLIESSPLFRACVPDQTEFP